MMIKCLYKIAKLLFKSNFFKTIYINFKTQPFNIAVRFPIVVYGKLKIYSLKGSIVIDAPISMGMIHIGKDFDHHPVSLNAIKMNIIGKLIFKGPAVISGGSTITAWKHGQIVLGANIRIGSGVQLKSENKIIIGDFSSIISLVVIMDTNIHLIKNIETGVIDKISEPIIIGKNCWINSGSIISKGTVIPDYCVSTRNTLFTKSSMENISTNSLLGGSPAKLLKRNIQRIFDYDEESKIKQIFFNNPEINEYQQEPGLFDEKGKTPDLHKL